MTTTAVPGDRLAELLQGPPGTLSAVDVTAPPSRWAPLKSPLVGFVRAARAHGASPPVFGGVPLCLFGSEWPGFPSRPRTTPPQGRCVPCAAQRSCGHAGEVPDELLPLSDAPPRDRWREYAAAFERVTGSAAAHHATPFLDRILAAYPGPTSLEPSLLLTDRVQPVARAVVFPHRIAPGAAGGQAVRTTLACVRDLLRTIDAVPCDDVLAALGSLRPLPIPVGVEGGPDAWRIKVYLRLEDGSPDDKQAVLDALARAGAPARRIALPDLLMVGLVFDRGGLHTVKAYVAAQPTRHGATGFPPPLPGDHPLVSLGNDRALATLDVWCRGPQRANKWDVNVREHYLAGASAAELVARLGFAASADRVRPLLVGTTYRADIVAVGVRGTTVALYLELN